MATVVGSCFRRLGEFEVYENFVVAIGVVEQLVVLVWWSRVAVGGRCYRHWEVGVVVVVVSFDLKGNYIALFMLRFTNVDVWRCDDAPCHKVFCCPMLCSQVQNDTVENSRRQLLLDDVLSTFNVALPALPDLVKQAEPPVVPPTSKKRNK